MPVQRHIINELKKDGLIIICFVDKGKAVMVEDILVKLIVGIFPNILLAKTLEVTRGTLD